MKLYDIRESEPAELEQLCRRHTGDMESALQVAHRILIQVKNKGEEALREYTKTLDRVELKELAVSQKEIATAVSRLSEELLSAIRQAAGNIEQFHRSQMTIFPRLETTPGVLCWTETRPIERVGLYVPGGSASLVSTLLMLAIPARLAGCPTVVVVTPPGPEGKIADALLAACHLCGVETVFRVGGAQAIAALAYGQAGLPKVDKIFGPGNRYVTAAKLLVSADPAGAAIDMAAGPSEVLIIADRFCRPDFVAADLLAQAEHDPDAAVVLVSDRTEVLRAVEEELQKQLKTLPRADICRRSLSHGLLLLARDLLQALEFSNRYAPEHLILNVNDWPELVPLIRNAGSVFLGPYACEAAGDYASGTNHCLPTSGWAKAVSGLAVADFQKRITFQTLSAAGARQLAPTVCHLAAAEGLEAHRRAMAWRVGENV